jgi:hypothetical protein
MKCVNTIPTSHPLPWSGVLTDARSPLVLAELNKNPACKQFIKQGGVDAYEVDVKFIPGHNPDLVLYDAADEVIERVDLTQYKSQEALAGVLDEKGVRKKAATPAAEEPSAKEEM